MEVQHTAHRPERQIVQQPAAKQPRGRTQRPRMPLNARTFRAALPSHIHDRHHEQIQRQKDEITPPDDRIAEQIDAMRAAREELTLTGK